MMVVVRFFLAINVNSTANSTHVWQASHFSIRRPFFVVTPMIHSTKKALLTLTIVAGFCSHALAANRYWDRNGSTMGSGNTGGVWDTTSSNWNNVSNGNSATTTISATDTAIFSAG